MDAVAPGDVWAVGGVGSGGLSFLHWDGRRWTQEPTHVPGPDKMLTAVSLLPSGDGWAVGYERAPNTPQGLALKACRA